MSSGVTPFAMALELRLRSRPRIVGEYGTNLVHSRRNVSFTSPVGPLRCLAMMISALLGSGVVRLYTILAVHEHHEVRVLLDRSRFSQVRELRAAGLVAGLDRARELRQRDDRDVELLGQAFRPRVICEISCTRFSARALERMSCR